MIEQEIKEKTIQWIKLEKEVMEEVIKKIANGEISDKEWAEYFIGAVKEHGNEDMINQLKVFVNYLKSVKSFTGETHENIDAMFENLRDI